VRGKGYLTVVILIVVFLVVLNLPLAVTGPLRMAARELLTPSQTVLVRFHQSFHFWWEGWVGAGQLARENDRLRGEMALLRGELEKADRANRENVELRDLLGLKQQARVPLVAAEVIAREDGGGWWQTVRINRGDNHRIRPGLPVIALEGLVGRTTNVTPNTSDVLLISDPNCKVGVRLSATGEFGILKGSGLAASGMPQFDVVLPAAPPEIDYLAKEGPVLEGEKIVTSGLGGVFPPDIPVGVLLSSKMDITGLFQRARIRPSVDLARLSKVFVMILPEETDPGLRKSTLMEGDVP
jgi:rod shape-determining protein MreC